MTKRFLSRIISITVLIAVAAGTLAAQRKVPSVEQMLNTGSLGTEFWITIPPNEINPYQTEALEVYIASAFDTDVEIYDTSGDKLIRRRARAFQTLTLSDATNETNWTWEVRDAEQPTRKAIRIKSQKPISVYVINSKVYTTDGFMAIPVNAWGTEYIATTYYDFREIRQWAGGFIIIARENSTKVDILLRGQGALDARTSGGRRIGERFTVYLDEGDVYMVKGDGTSRGLFDLTGTLVNSDKPIGFMSFHERTTMPNLLVNGNGRNHLVEMTPPTTTWGKQYMSLEYKRAKGAAGGRGDVFRVVAKEANTKWSLKYYDKVSKQLLGQNGGVLNAAGTFADITQASAPTALTEGFSVWTADKPVFIMQYSCSSSWDGDRILDPFMINVTPEEQFLTSTIFQFPTMAQFTLNRLNLVVKVDTTDPDYLNHLRSLTIDGVPVWNHPKAESPSLLFTRMPNGFYWTIVEFGNEKKGHYITGNGKVKFGGYIYGYGPVDAYGWPAAAGFRPTGFIDTMKPVITGSSVCGDYTFEATELRNIPDPPRNPRVGDSDQVEQGIAMIDTIPGSNSFNYRLELITAPEFSSNPPYYRFKYEWRVIDKSKDAYCKYFVSDFFGNTTEDSCFYFADKVSISPNPLNFGKLRLGSKSTLDVTLTNNSDAAINLTNSRLIAGTYFRVVTGGMPPVVTIPAKGTHRITIEYTGSRETQNIRTDFDQDTLIVNTDCGVFPVPMVGVAAIPKITVNDFDAETVSVNQKACKAGGIRITNPGSDTLVITSINGYGGTNFTVTPPPSLPIVIPPDSSFDLKEVCYQSSTVTVDEINVTFGNNGDGPDSVSNWKGNTQSPGPIIRGYDWSERRVGTLHTAYGLVTNTGNQELTLRAVTFQGGGQYYPAGATEANYVFKIVGLYNGGNPVVLPKISNGSTVDVLVMFRPDAEAVFTATIVPEWVEAGVDPRTARLDGIGILPKIATAPITLNCQETPEGVPTQRTITVTNAGSMPLTLTAMQFQGGAPAGFTFVTTPTFPLVVPRNGGTTDIVVSYRRPITFLGGVTATVEFVHDATPGDGTDSVSLRPVAPHTETITVGSCSAPDITTTNIDYGRQRANCDSPVLTFSINNPSGSLKPLEVKAITETGADPGAFEIMRILDASGAVTNFPLIIQAGQTFRVEVRFTPTEPNAAPWADRTYNAAYEIVGYGQGDADPLKTVTANVTGVGYVTPIRFDLVNDLNGSETRNPGATVNYAVRGVSGDWPSVDLTSFVADVTFATDDLAMVPGTATANVAGWTVNDPVVTRIDATRSQARFTVSGPTRVSADGPIFSFKAELLLSKNFTSHQSLGVTMPLPCVVGTTTGDSTAIFNCAITRRVVSMQGTTPGLAPVRPTPTTGGTANVEFGVGITSKTTIDLINSQGVVVRTLVSERLEGGMYDMSFTTQGLASGVYLLRMQTAAYTGTQQIVISN